LLISAFLILISQTQVGEKCLKNEQKKALSPSDERAFIYRLIYTYFTSSKITRHDYQHSKDSWYKYDTKQSSIFLRHIGIISVLDKTKILKKNRNVLNLVSNDLISFIAKASPF